PISRLFVILGGGATLTLLWAWRGIFYRIITRPRWLPRLQRRVAILGWSDGARSLVNEVQLAGAHPFTIVGNINRDATATSSPFATLGTVDELSVILEREKIDILLAASLEFDPDRLAAITATCERAYVEWKILP